MAAMLTVILSLLSPVELLSACTSDLVGALSARLGETEEIGASLQRVWDSPDAASALVEWARHQARIHPKILPVMQAAERARHVDPDAAALWDAGQKRWLAGARRLISWLAEERRLAEGWASAAASDMTWALMSPKLLERLIIERRWSPRRVGEHLGRLLVSTFVANQGGPSDVCHREEEQL
jgi:hypothetical protein